MWVVMYLVSSAPYPTMDLVEQFLKKHWYWSLVGYSTRQWTSFGLSRRATGTNFLVIRLLISVLGLPPPLTSKEGIGLMGCPCNRVV